MACTLCNSPLSNAHRASLQINKFSAGYVRQLGLREQINTDSYLPKSERLLLVSNVPFHWTIPTLRHYFENLCGKYDLVCSKKKAPRSISRKAFVESLESFYFSNKRTVLVLFNSLTDVKNILNGERHNRLSTAASSTNKVASCALCEIYDILLGLHWNFGRPEGSKTLRASMLENLYKVGALEMIAENFSGASSKINHTYDANGIAFMGDLYACLDVRHGYKPNLHRKITTEERIRPGNKMKGSDQRRDYDLSREEFSNLYMSCHYGIGGPSACRNMYVPSTNTIGTTNGRNPVFGGTSFSQEDTSLLYTFQTNKADTAMWKNASVPARRLQQGPILSLSPHKLLALMQQKIYPFRLFCEQISILSDNGGAKLELSDFDIYEAFSLMPQIRMFRDVFTGMLKVYKTISKIQGDMSPDQCLAFFFGLSQPSCYRLGLTKYQYVQEERILQFKALAQEQTKSSSHYEFLALKFQLFFYYVGASFRTSSTISTADFKQSVLTYYRRVSRFLMRVLIIKNVLEIGQHCLNVLKSLHKRRAVSPKDLKMICFSFVQGCCVVFSYAALAAYIMHSHCYNNLASPDQLRTCSDKKYLIFDFPVWEGKGLSVFGAAMVVLFLQLEDDEHAQKLVVDDSIDFHCSYRKIKFTKLVLRSFHTGKTQSVNCLDFINEYILDHPVCQNCADETSTSVVEDIVQLLLKDPGAISNKVFQCIRLVLLVLIVWAIVTCAEITNPVAVGKKCAKHSHFLKPWAILYLLVQLLYLLVVAGLSLGLYKKAMGIFVSLVRFTSLIDPLKASKKTKSGNTVQTHVHLPGYMSLDNGTNVMAWLTMRRFLLIVMQKRLYIMGRQTFYLAIALVVCIVIRIAYYAEFAPFPLASGSVRRELKEIQCHNQKAESEIFSAVILLISIPLGFFIKRMADINFEIETHCALMASSYHKTLTRLYNLKSSMLGRGAGCTMDQQKNTAKSLALFKYAIDVFKLDQDDLKLGYFTITHGWLFLTVFPIFSTLIVPIFSYVMNSAVFS